MPTRYSSEIDRLRAALRSPHRPAEVPAILRRELEALTLAALAADSSARYVGSNAAACALTGYSEAELRTMRVADLTPVPHAEDAARLWEDFIDAGSQHGDYELRRKDGTSVRVRYWAFANVAPDVHVSLLVPSRT